MKFFILFSVFSIASGWLFANPFNYFRPAINITNSTDAWILNSTNFTDIEDTEKYFNISDFSDIDLEALCTVNDSNSTSFTSSNTIDPSLAISKYTDHSSDKSSKFNHINSSFSHNYTSSNSTDFAFNITEVCTFFNAINVNITDTATTTDELTTNPPECNSNNCDQLLPLMNWNNLTMIVWPSTEQEAIEYCDHWAKYGLCLEKYSTAKKSDCIRDVVIEDDQLTMSLVEKYHSLVCQNSSTMVSFIDRAACYLHPSVLEDIFTARYQWKAMTSWDQVCATLWFIESIRSSMDRNCEASVAESYQAMVDVLLGTANKATGLFRTYKSCRDSLSGPSQKFLDFITGIADHRILFKFGETSMKILRFGKELAPQNYSSFSFERGGNVNGAEQQGKGRSSSMYMTLLWYKVSNTFS